MKALKNSVALLLLFAFSASAQLSHDEALKGEVSGKNQIWADWYYPYLRGGLHYRNSTPSITHLLQELSPDQKIKKHTRLEKGWEGFCDVVAEVSTKYCPKAGILELSNGKKVEVTSSEMKRLLYFYFDLFNRAKNELFVPSRYADNPAFEGLLPSAFHYMLTHRIGIDRKPLMLNLGTSRKIFNVVVIAYQTVPTVISDNETQYETEIEYLPVLHHFAGETDTSAGNGSSKKSRFVYSISEKHWAPEDLEEQNFHFNFKSRWISKEKPWFLWTANDYRVENDERVPEAFRNLIRQTSLCP